MTDTVRIVVAEGVSSRKGFLRFVLEGEGYEVVGEAATPAELARSVGLHEPDVVVMDDGIGATSVGMVRELSPAAKVILVWPGAVMPIGGDARVEPSNVLRELGLAVEGITGVACATSLAAGGAAGAGGAATLREVLARGDAAQLHRGADAAPEGAAAAAAAAAAGAGVAALAATAGGPDAAGAGVLEPAAAALVDPAAMALNRRLGTIALSGAAAAGALVLALALGGSRVPVASLSGAAAEPSSPGIGQPSIAPIEPGGGGGTGEGTGEVSGGWRSGGSQSRAGNEPLCNYYIETCLPPAGLTGTGGLSVGDIYGSVDGSAAAAPKAGHHGDGAGRSKNGKTANEAKDGKAREDHKHHKDRKDRKARQDRKREAA
jgi:DNA-binding NarL/FixJ family response regulator